LVDHGYRNIIGQDGSPYLAEIVIRQLSEKFGTAREEPSAQWTVCHDPNSKFSENIIDRTERAALCYVCTLASDPSIPNKQGFPFLGTTANNVGIYMYLQVGIISCSASLVQRDHSSWTAVIG
jgi:hypothetical protein